MSRLSKNIIYNLFGQGLLMVLGFVAVKYIFKQLGEEVLGIIYFTAMMNAVLCAMLEMGICSTTVREVSAHFESEPDYIHDLIRTASLFYWGAYALLGLTIYFLAPILVEKWINLKTMDASTATTAIRIIGVASLITLPQRFYASLFRGLQRMGLTNFIDVSIIALQQIGIVVIIVLHGGLVHIAYWYLACFGLSILTYLFASAHFFSWQALVPRYSSGVVRRNFGYSLNLMSISMLSIIHMQADKLIISKLLPIGVVGYYGVGYASISKGISVPDAVSQAAFPSFSALFKVGNYPDLISQYRKLQDMVCLTTVPLFAAIPFATVPLFSYVFNREIAKMLLLPMTFLCVGFYMHGTMTIPYFFSLAVGKPGISAKSNFIALFTVLPVTGVLIYFFGLAGAGFSWVFYHLFAYAYAVPRICSECLKIPTKEWYAHIGKILAVASLSYGIAWTLPEFIGTQSILALTVAYLGGSAVFIFGAYWLASKELKTVLWRLFHTLRMRSAEVA
jgi:O-antigen/teichoic acid export membrane protein